MRPRSVIRPLASLGVAVMVVLATAAPASAAGSHRPAPPADRTAPTMPGNLRVTAVTHTSISVAWSPSTDNVGVRDYIVWVDGLGLGVVAVKPPQTHATWTLGLRPGRPYTVNVRAYDAAYNGSATASVAATTPPDVIAPTVPGALTASSVTASTALLTWSSSTDADGFVAYDVLVDGAVTPDALSTRQAGSPPSSVSGAVVRQLSPGTTHTLAVRARDRSGNVSAVSDPVTVTTQPSGDRTAPTAPVLTSASGGGTGSCPDEIWLRFNRSTDDSGSLEYEIRVNGTIIEVAPGGATGWVTYTEVFGANEVTLVAVDAAGNASAPSNAITTYTNWGFGSCPFLD